MIPNKESLGINGDHQALGRKLDMAEFKGFVVSEIGNINKNLKEIKEENEKQWDVIVKNRSKLDVMKGQALTRATFVSAIISIGVVGIAWMATNLDKIIKAFGG